MSALAGLCLGQLVVVAAAMSITALVARRVGRWSVVDVTWGLGFVAIALLWWVVALRSETGVARASLLLVLVGIWGLRLAWHIGRRSVGHGEDPRYAAIKARQPSYVRAALLPQGIAMFVISLPIAVSQVFGQARIGWLAWIGVLVWVVGLLFEAIGDAQLAAYKREPKRRPVMDRGLWRYTRHPNYFGDACVWWGIWLVAADSGIRGAATVISPIAMTYFLIFATGARLLERSMMKRPGYSEYAARTSMFFPLPPKPGTR